MKTQAHQRYENYPGVTTVLGVLNKPGLPKWANNLGLRGIDSSRFVSEAAETGTLAHEMIVSYFSGKPCDTKDYSANQITRAEQALSMFHKWAEVYKPRAILLEKSLISHRYGYGGTLDLYAELTIGDRQFREICDFKTGSGPWPTHFAQLAAYRVLLEENGYEVENARLIKVPVDPSIQTFSESQLLHLDSYWKLFRHCLAIYKMKIL